MAVSRSIGHLCRKLWPKIRTAYTQDCKRTVRHFPLQADYCLPVCNHPRGLVIHDTLSALRRIRKKNYVCNSTCIVMICVCLMFFFQYSDYFYVSMFLKENDHQNGIKNLQQLTGGSVFSAIIFSLVPISPLSYFSSFSGLKANLLTLCSKMAFSPGFY